jgi:hypothetical protein
MKSKYNRSGHVIEFIVESLTVFDDDLGAWRRANADLTVRRPESVEAIVCASSFLDMTSEHFVVLTQSDGRLAKLEQAAAHLRETALPWFAGSAQPERLARSVPEALLTPWGFAQDLMEFLVSTGNHAEAHTLWRRVRESNVPHQQAFTAGGGMAQTGATVAHPGGRRVERGSPRTPVSAHRS